MERTELGYRLQSWHSSMQDPIYAVGSFYFADKIYPKKSVVEDALVNLRYDLDKYKRMLAGEKVPGRNSFGPIDDLREFAGFTDEQIKENTLDLEEIIQELESFLKKDYAP